MRDDSANLENGKRNEAGARELLARHTFMSMRLRGALHPFCPISDPSSCPMEGGAGRKFRALCTSSGSDADKSIKSGALKLPSLSRIVCRRYNLSFVSNKEPSSKLEGERQDAYAIRSPLTATNIGTNLPVGIIGRCVCDRSEEGARELRPVTCFCHTCATHCAGSLPHRH